MGLKFYKKVAYGSKLKVTKFGRVINIFREREYKEELVWVALFGGCSTKKKILPDTLIYINRRKIG